MAVPATPLLPTKKKKKTKKHTQSSPPTVKKCCGKLVEVLYTQLLVAITACVLFSIYKSTQVMLPDARQTRVDPATFSQRSVEAQLREKALQRLALEAAEYENDDEFDSSGRQQLQQQQQQQSKQKHDENVEEHYLYNHNPPRTQRDKNGNGYIVINEEEELEAKTSNPDYEGFLVQPGDFVYQNLPGESAPIVLEDYKLIFFAQAKVGCTVWKLLFRRMMGHDNWRDQRDGLPHVRAVNGLKYLDEYNVSYASQIMSDPQWTRAIFVRDPKERFLSAYLDKAVETNLFVDTCCNRHRQIHCNPAPPAMHEFLTAIQQCHDSHWDPQSQRMEEKYWKYINFVGHLETVQADAKRLLQQLGVWERFGRDGWGRNRTAAIFESKDGTFHANNAKSKLKEFLYPQIEQEVEEFYEQDYQHELFNLSHSIQFQGDTAIRTAVDHSSLGLPMVEPRDWIYRKSKLHGEAAPIVLEQYKLVFFAVPYVAENEFKRLFRRMMGREDWKTRKYDRKHHDAMNEGLVFLRDYNMTRASEIMTSPNWTRAIFVRDPKERFSMAYTNTAVRQRQLLHQICCTVVPRMFCLKGKGTRALLDYPNSTVFLRGIHTCKSTHWDPISERMNAMRRMGIHILQKRAFDSQNYFTKNKYWKYVNFVGNMDTAYQDAKALLDRLGVWREFGVSGWADTPEEARSYRDTLFKTSSFLKRELTIKTGVQKVIIDPDMEKSLEVLYGKDYNNPLFNLTKKVLFASSGSTFVKEAQMLREKLKEISEETSKQAHIRQW